MTVRCSRCGEEWPREPALEVPCPTCHAPVGVRCRRPSGHSGNFVGLHPARDREAMQQGHLKPCPMGERARRGEAASEAAEQTALLL